MANSKKPKVSILIPVYNVEKYLAQCLESVVGQSLKEIEIICLNDGSTDGSLKIINKFAKKDPRIVVVNKVNSGYGDSMNQGLALAQGEYIGIVESDDFIELNAFERLYSLAKQNGADVVRANYYHYKGGVDTKYSYIEHSDPDHLAKPLDNQWIFYQAPAIWSAIYRNSFLKRQGIKFLPTPGASYQDTGFNFKVWTSTEKAVFTDEAFLHYRLDNESSSVNNPGKIFNVCKEYAEIEQYLRGRNKYNEFAKLMQAAKFGAYYWNIYRLARDLRAEFVAQVKDEFMLARDENMLDVSYFKDKAQWKCLKYILSHNNKAALGYIRHKETYIKAKSNLRNALIKMGIKK